MDKENVKLIPEEEIKEKIPTQIKYMTLSNGEVRIVDNDERNSNNQQFFVQKNIEKNENSDYINELNEEYIEDNSNQETIYKKEENDKINLDNQNEEKEGNYDEENIRLYKQELMIEENPKREREIQTFQVMNDNNNNDDDNPRIQYQNEMSNEEFINNKVPPNRIIPVEKNQILYNKRINNKIRPPIRNNLECVVREKSNYTLYSSNNCKSTKNSYIPKKYIGSEKTTFMEEKNIDTISNSHSRQETELGQEIKENLLNKRFLSPRNTKMINAVPLENYSESQMIQKKNAQNSEPKIYVATDDSDNLINRNINEQYQIIKSPNNNNIHLENIKSNVLYHKQGYGNSEDVQKKLKMKKKRKIYIRNKPIALQHFNVQIIQNPIQVENIENPQTPIYRRQYQAQPPIEYQSPINSQNINFAPPFVKEKEQYIEIIPPYIQENSIPPIRNNINQNYINPNYVNPNLIKVFPSQEEIACRCLRHPPSPQYYIPSTPQPYYREKEKDYRNNVPYSPKQTLISLTPMRTMNEPTSTSPYQENIEIPMNNNRYIIRERNNGFRPLTPTNPPPFERQYYRGENDNENYCNDYEMRRRNNYYPRRRIVEPIIVYDDGDGEMIEEDDNPRYRMDNMGNNY